MRYDIAMSETFLITGPDNPPATILLAHGAGAPMDSKSMTAASEALVGKGFRIARFEFAYMAARRTSDARKPPPKAETLPLYIGDDFLRDLLRKAVEYAFKDRAD